MSENTTTAEQAPLHIESVPKIQDIKEVPIDEVLRKRALKSLTEVRLDNGQVGKICRLDNTSAYSAQSLAEIRDRIDDTQIAVMLDNNFEDKSDTNWIPLYKTTTDSEKSLVARFDPENRVLHIDHHLSLEEIGDTPLNQEFNPELLASTTPLAVSFFRGLQEGTLFTDAETGGNNSIKNLNSAWDAKQFLVFVDHFDPDSTESTMVVLKATRENIAARYFDELATTALDADHIGSYRHPNGTENVRERLVKALSDLEVLAIPQTIQALHILENLSDESNLTQALKENNLDKAAELYEKFEKTLQSTEKVAEKMTSHYNGHGNLLYNILPGDTQVDMAYLTSLLRKKHEGEIGPNGFEYCLVIKDFGKDEEFPDTNAYGVWLRTLHEGVDLNDFQELLEILGIYGRSSARGNRNLTSFATTNDVTFPLDKKTDAASKFNTGSRWRARNPYGLVKTLELILSRDAFIDQIEDFLGHRPDEVLASRKIPGTEQERGVVIDTFSTGQRSGEQRVLKFLIFPRDEKPDSQFLNEIRTAGIVAALLKEGSEQLVLIPETTGLFIRPGFVAAEFEKVEMIYNPITDENRVPIVVDGERAHVPISYYFAEIMSHIDDMRRVPMEILETGGVPVATEKKYKTEFKEVLHTLKDHIPGDLTNSLGQLEFQLSPEDRVLVNGRTKPSNMFMKDGRIGQTDWQSIKQGHPYEDQVALVTIFLLTHPDKAEPYMQGMDPHDPSVEFLFVRKALLAIEYNLDKIDQLKKAGDHEEVEITRQKIDVHWEIIRWALSEDKNLEKLKQTTFDVRKLLLEHRPKIARRDSQLFGYSLDELR